MDVMNDHSQGVSYFPSEYEKPLKLARELLKFNVNKVLAKLDYDEWISLIFLLFDEANAYLQGFKNIADISDNRIQQVTSSICRTLLSSCQDYDSVYDPLIEAFYHIRRYDILEDDLKLCLDHSLHQVCESLHCILPENLALFQVFSSLTQEEANRLTSLKLRNWHSHNPDEMFEVKFLRNFDPKRNSYVSLIMDLHSALVEENLLPMARFLEPFVWGKRYSPLPPPVSPGVLDPSEFYPMADGEPHGLCVIINVREFKEFEGSRENFPCRRGSDVDKDLMCGTFKLFGFTVVHLDDPDYEMFCNFFLNLRRDMRLHAMAALVVCVMTHGDKDDNLYLTDGKCVAVTELRRLCYARALIGKPKMFFIQACRGNATLNPMFLQRDGTTISNTEADCIISEATVKDYSAMRSQSTGSWYINDLCTTLQEMGHLRPLRTVLNETRSRLSSRVELFHDRYITQISEDKATLTKEIQLQRGNELFVEGILDLTELKLFEDLIQCCVASLVDLPLGGAPGEVGLFHDPLELLA